MTNRFRALLELLRQIRGDGWPTLLVDTPFSCETSLKC